ncbi:MAG: hypothetical protein IJ430_00380 [Parabacteroides sp.]|nr:hypothetical protein [Parabacteroides sp.]
MHRKFINEEQKKALAEIESEILSDLKKQLGIDDLNKIVEDDSKNELDLFNQCKEKIDQTKDESIDEVMNEIFITVNNDPRVKNKEELIRKITEYYEQRRKGSLDGSDKQGGTDSGVKENAENGENQGRESLHLGENTENRDGEGQTDGTPSPESEKREERIVSDLPSSKRATGE